MLPFYLHFDLVLKRMLLGRLLLLENMELSGRDAAPSISVSFVLCPCS